MTHAAPDIPADEARRGFFYALAAYLLWGVLPMYIAALTHIDPFEIVAHRIVWSVPVAAAILAWQGRLGEFAQALAKPRVVLTIALTAVLIAVNWLAYVTSVSLNVASEAALGYYINPLISVLIGWLALGERLAKLQWIAVAFAAVAVAVLTVQVGAFPLLALTMAISFAAYGYFRKTVDVAATPGFLLEAVLLAPFAAIYILYLAGTGTSDAGWSDWWLLLGCGPVTAVPLILFSQGAKRLRLSTIGLMQYIAPTLIFLTAWLVFLEPIPAAKWIAFALIWTALALYTWSSLRRPA